MKTGIGNAIGLQTLRTYEVDALVVAVEVAVTHAGIVSGGFEGRSGDALDGPGERPYPSPSAGTGEVRVWLGSDMEGLGFEWRS